MMFSFDPMYWLFLGPAMLLSLVATLMTKATFAKYSKIRAASGYTGAQAARRMLDMQGAGDVAIEQVGGFLSDHYDPRTRTLRLSPDVYSSPSLSAIGVACHEAGHALQDATHYAPLKLRSAMVPAAQFGSFASYIFILIGCMMSAGHGTVLVEIGIVLFSIAVLFSVVTLPVEWNASARAKELMVTSGIVSHDEQADAAKVLNAAFMTYLAAAITALLELLYWLWKLGLIGGGRRRD